MEPLGRAGGVTGYPIYFHTVYHLDIRGGGQALHPAGEEAGHHKHSYKVKEERLDEGVCKGDGCEKQRKEIDCHQFTSLFSSLLCTFVNFSLVITPTADIICEQPLGLMAKQPDIQESFRFSKTNSDFEKCYDF